ncbi:MAG: hotdog fold thioesterase [Sediminibacterium sp.]|nr:hotdog fold thioesterase [Sediminibacterium sp.]
MPSAEEIVTRMFEKDAFSQWLGIERLAVKEGYCLLKLRVREDMLNGFGIAHGGITYSLADSALAFASNSKGRQAVSIETSISHIQKTKAGDCIVAEAKELERNQKLAHYEVRLYDEATKHTVALFKGIVYLSSKNWD